MIETTENLAREYQVTREDADAYADDSHKRVAAAAQSGKFDDEIVPIEVPQRLGDPTLFATDEGVRADASIERLAKLRPIMKDGVVYKHE